MQQFSYGVPPLLLCTRKSPLSRDQLRRDAGRMTLSLMRKDCLPVWDIVLSPPAGEPAASSPSTDQQQQQNKPTMSSCARQPGILLSPRAMCYTKTSRLVESQV